MSFMCMHHVTRGSTVIIGTHNLSRNRGNLQRKTHSHQCVSSLGVEHMRQVGGPWSRDEVSVSAGHLE